MFDPGNSTRRGAFLRMAVVLIVATSCGRESTTDAPADAAKFGRRVATTDAGNFTVGLAVDPDPIPLNAHFTLDLDIAPSPADDVELRVDADMPAHGHGMYTAPKVERVGPGRYRAHGFLFHMHGEWRIDVDVIRGTRVERASFTVDLPRR